MIAELLALFSALFYGVRGIFIKKGLRDSNPLSAALVSMLMSSITQSILLIFSFPSSIIMDAFLFFFLSGVFICVTTVLNPIGIHKLGVSINTPVQGSYPMFSTIMAIIVLREVLSPLVYVGIGLIIIGLAFLSYKGGENSGWIRIELFYPISSAAAIAAASTLKKIGLNILYAPIALSLVSTVTALGIYLSFLIASRKLKKTMMVNKRSFAFFSLSGVSFGLATTIFAYALHIGELTRIVPLSSTEILFALFLSYIFLRDVEIINRRILLASVLVVLGIICITVYK